MAFKLKKEDKKPPKPLTDLSQFEVKLPEINDESSLQKEFNPWDYIRVVNVRGEPEFQPNEDEKVIIGHRDNPVLGNKNVKQSNTMQERDRVIAEHKKDLAADLAIQGPMWQSLQAIAEEIVEKKQKIAISCWCLPRACHVSAYIPIIVEMIVEKMKLKMQPLNNVGNINFDTHKHIQHCQCEHHKIDNKQSIHQETKTKIKI